MKKKNYKKGLVIGKFMPPHKGHLELIKFAFRRCEKLIVAVCSRPEEPIAGKLRYQWMKEMFNDHKNITIAQIKKDLPQDREPSHLASRAWARYLGKRFENIDVMFSSEIYGRWVGKYMGVDHVMFDLERKKIPVSATQIRRDPFKHWEYIPSVVKPYFVKKICIYGPESTGKSTLAEQLAEHYKTVFVPEYARGYIERHGNKFSYKDMEIVAKRQAELEKEMAEQADKLLFCDTDSITTLIYSRHYFRKASKIVKKLADKKRYELYLFMKTDIPWVDDPQRDLGGRREEFEGIFKRELARRNIPFVTITGKGRARLDLAIKAVDDHLGLQIK